MTYRRMTETDIARAVSIYITYYNNKEDGEWTETTTQKRIHQVLTREDSFCLVLEENNSMIAFAMGYFEQFDDGFVYNLVEIVVNTEWQGKGVGTAFMKELESQVKKEGAILIILDAVNDAFHEHFYGKLGFQTATNLVIMSKVLRDE